MDEYERSVDPYGNSVDPYGNSVDPYERSVDTHERSKNPYQRNVDTNEKSMDTYERSMDAFERSTDTYAGDASTLYGNQRIQQVEEKKENIIAGIVGAFLGTLIGLLCIVVVDQLGYMASISGVVMGVCAIKGYQLLAGKMSLKGIVISSVFMICVVYVSQQLSWAIDAADVLNIDVFSAFRLIPEMIRQGAIDGGIYMKDLFMLYAFTALGAVPTIWNTIKTVTNRSV
ncbi:hypothetical protein [uncultured Robinsoniella sp.]|uniref:hypothetical protein n=1 Tax=uncultured Robinsoniella sp. TaxID=904190 RepID=UPI00374FB13A